MTSDDPRTVSPVSPDPESSGSDLEFPDAPQRFNDLPRPAAAARSAAARQALGRVQATTPQQDLGLTELAAHLRALHRHQTQALGPLGDTLLGLITRWRHLAAQPQGDAPDAAQAQGLTFEQCADELEQLIGALSVPGSTPELLRLHAERLHARASGWTAENDDLMVNGELPRAAAAYALSGAGASRDEAVRLWPSDWQPHSFRPSGERDLIKGAVLLLDEAARLGRLGRQEWNRTLTHLAAHADTAETQDPGPHE